MAVGNLMDLSWYSFQQRLGKAELAIFTADSVSALLFKSFFPSGMFCLLTPLHDGV